MNFNCDFVVVDIINSTSKERWNNNTFVCLRRGEYEIETEDIWQKKGSSPEI